MANERILLVEDDSSLNDLLRDELESEGYVVTACDSAEQAQFHLSEEIPDLLISDIRLPGAKGLSLLPLIQELPAPPSVLFITAFGTVRQAVEALKAGADDFITKPLDMDYLLLSVARLLANRRLQHEVERYRSLLKKDDFHGIISSSPNMTTLISQVQRMASADGAVLITGESGTGKELVARAIHDESSRKEAPYLTVNCGGIPGELLESEFFGHTAGAFTGARNRRLGFFQQAAGGTLLLDEIGEMPVALQAKLLRVLQDGEVRPVGSDTTHRVDIRIIAATNKDLKRAVSDGTFREDLLFRLDAFHLEIPPLRERGEDILLLANQFLNSHSLRQGTTIRGFSDAALQRLLEYPFPGNVRELKNVVERAVTFCDGEIIEPGHFPQKLRDYSPSDTEACTATPQSQQQNSFESNGLVPLETMQRNYINYVVRQVNGNKRRAASILGITRRTLYRWLN